MIDPRATVIREGRRATIAAENIVPGDLVLLEPGDRVPTDLSCSISLPRVDNPEWKQLDQRRLT
jgi:hypothetical protein